jgi:hypothetical protein
MARDMNDHRVRKPMLRPVRGRAGGAAQSDMFPKDSEGGVWGTLLEASPWSNRPFRNLQNTPMLSFVDGQNAVLPEDPSQMWQPGWAGGGVASDADQAPEANPPALGADAGLAQAQSAPGAAPIIDIDPEVGASPKPAPAPISASKPPTSPGLRSSQPAKGAGKLPPRASVTAKPVARRVKDVPVENLLTGVVTLVGSGLVGAAGLAAYAGAITVSALGLGGNKKRPATAPEKK